MLLYSEVSKNHFVCGDTRLHSLAVGGGGRAESLLGCSIVRELNNIKGCRLVCWVPSHQSFLLTSVIYSFPVVGKILAKYLKWYMHEEKLTSCDAS